MRSDFAYVLALTFKIKKLIIIKLCGCSSMVEHQLPKLRAEGSIPFTRSNKKYFKALICKVFLFFVKIPLAV